MIFFPSKINKFGYIHVIEILTFSTCIREGSFFIIHDVFEKLNLKVLSKCQYFEPFLPCTNFRLG